MTDWTDLPWQSLVVIASGYAAYTIAFIGLRQHHKAIDAGLASLVFGLVAMGVIGIGGLLSAHPLISGSVAVMATFAVAVFWRRWGRAWLRGLLHRFDVSWSDDDPSAWFALATQQDYFVSQIAVHLDDGTWLRCDDTERFADAPFGPCLLGPNGDVAFYLTHEDRSGNEDRELRTVQDDEYGDRITYVPASRIKSINMRHTRTG